MDQDYNAQVIQFFAVRLDSLSNAAFTGGIIQRLIKPPAVLTFTDSTNDARLNLALKRLNRNNTDEVVIDEQFTTSPFNTLPGDDTYRLLGRHVAFAQLKNRQDKAALYAELYTKAAIIDQRKLIPQAEDLLDSAAFFTLVRTIGLLALINEYTQTLAAKAQENTLAGKATHNVRLKAIAQKLAESV